jgi:iron complex outermembrane recepter protein
MVGTWPDYRMSRKFQARPGAIVNTMAFLDPLIAALLCENRTMSRRRSLSLLMLSVIALPAQAQSGVDRTQATDDTGATDLDTIRVVAAPRSLSQLPGTASVLDAETLRDGQRQVNLSEALQRVPGITALDRQNYAQDLQIQSRGFGARSTFGIRGIRLVVDDLPASAADGQGQAAAFPLSTLDRVEVLRGPLALLYGNASGGAIVGRSVLDAPSGIEADAWAGNHAARRFALRADAKPSFADDALRLRLGANAFETDGVRAHSATRRRQFNAVGEWTPREGDSLRLMANALRQPLAQDPLGLDRATYRRDPQATDPVAVQFDTRKTIDESQMGLQWRSERATGEWWLGAYGGRREIEQFLSIPIVAQRAASSAGGVIDLGRDSRGIDAGRRWRSARGSLAVGVEANALREQRRGYENFIGTDPATATLGVRGRLRRDERNRVDTVDAYAVADMRIATDWTALAGVRRSRMRFDSDDRFLANGDDSGGRRETADAWSLGIVRALAHGEWYLNRGRGFESPTLVESAYRPDGEAGFNRELRNARSDAWEAGARWRSADGVHRGEIALYRIDGRDEIVPAFSRGGRASFANAGATRRLGVEVAVSGALSEQWRYALAASWIDATFVEDFEFRVATGTQVSLRQVEAGARIPGIPRADAFAELLWRSQDGRWSSAFEVRARGAIAVDDRNTDFAAGHARFAWRGQWRPRADAPWSVYARIDHLSGRAQIGSVIVNEANGRFFEPAADREFTLGLRWRFEP